MRGINQPMVDKQKSPYHLTSSNYAKAKQTTAQKVLEQWDSLNLTNFIYEMYEIYHVERLENAFDDIDELILENQN